MAVSTSCLCILLSPSISVASLPLPSPLSFSPSSQLLQKKLQPPGLRDGGRKRPAEGAHPARLGKRRGAAPPGRWSPLGDPGRGAGLGAETIDRAPARRPCALRAARLPGAARAGDARRRGALRALRLPGPRSLRGNGAAGGRAGVGRPRDPGRGP